MEVTLREYQLTDLDDLFVWASDERASAWSMYNTCNNKDDVLVFMEKKVLTHPWMRAICLNDRPVGAISVTRYTAEYHRCCAELAYVLASQHWGKGIGTEAVKLVLGTIFGDMKGLKRLQATVLVGNVASQRVLEKAGFTKEGVLKNYMIHKGKISDMIMYSFVPTDN